jgi:hypothetical protein
MEIYVISWPAVQDRAYEIARTLESAGHDVTTIYSGNSEVPTTCPGKWIRVSQKDFFGDRCERILQLITNEIVLIIHADTNCSDWLALANRCAELFLSHREIGIWSPTIDNTPWRNEEVYIADFEKTGLIAVMQTDGIVFALRREICARLSSFSFKQNSLGWGIDWAAICFAYSHNLIAVRDLSCFVTHQKGTGYSQPKAMKDMEKFLDQQTFQEQILYRLLLNHFKLNRRTQKKRKMLIHLMGGLKILKSIKGFLVKNIIRSKNTR